MRHKGLIVIVVLILAFAASGLTQASGTAAGYCYQSVRLTPGTNARVTLYPNQPNRIRSDASFYGTVTGYIPAGGTFAVLSGPYCNGYTNWWQVSYNGLTGWTPEGQGNEYWVEPIFG